MRTVEIECRNVVLSVEGDYDYCPGDRNTPPGGILEIYKVFAGDVDIYDLLDVKVLDEIEELFYQEFK